MGRMNGTFLHQGKRSTKMEVDQSGQLVMDTGRQLELIDLSSIMMLWLDIGRHLFFTVEILKVAKKLTG